MSEGSDDIENRCRGIPSSFSHWVGCMEDGHWNIWHDNISFRIRRPGAAEDDRLFLKGKEGWELLPMNSESSSSKTRNSIFSKTVSILSVALIGVAAGAATFLLLHEYQDYRNRADKGKSERSFAFALSVFDRVQERAKIFEAKILRTVKRWSQHLRRGVRRHVQQNRPSRVVAAAAPVATGVEQHVPLSWHLASVEPVLWLTVPFWIHRRQELFVVNRCGVSFLPFLWFGSAALYTFDTERRLEEGRARSCPFRLVVLGSLLLISKPWTVYLSAGYAVASTAVRLCLERDGEEDNNGDEDGTASTCTRTTASQQGLSQDIGAWDRAAALAGPMGNNPNTPSPSRYLELLVHNVSHTDLVLGLNLSRDSNDDNDNQDPYSLARARFSCFDKYSRRLLNALESSSCVSSAVEDELVHLKRYRRSVESPRYSIKEEPMAQAVPAGFVLSEGVPADAGEIRVRGRDQDRLNNESHDVRIRQVFFPLLATLLPRWQRRIDDKQYPRPVKKVVVLVTGVGTPRNWTHSMTGNSTQACADLMEIYLKRVNPELVVVKVHSETNIFRYDENLLFVEQELMPTLNRYRDAHALGLPYPDEDVGLPTTERTQPFNTDWRRSLALTLSFADGSPARTHAIQASLRPYRPIYFHFWQLKTFWHESKIVDDDIEVHSFEAMEHSPAVDADNVSDPQLQAVIKEIKTFRDEVVATLKSGDHDINKFWLRKTQRPVLAVLMVQSKDMREPKLYRGTNMEVSMPTGSLCAERNVIGTALAAHPNLRRDDLKLIAVLAVPTPIEVDPTLDRSPSAASIVLSGSDWESYEQKPSSDEDAAPTSDEWVIAPHQMTESSYSAVEGTTVQGQHNEPLRRIALLSRTAGRAQRHVVVRSATDLNPLKPCGACNEWLKKIAESNPYFQIVTFTDSDCHGTYCTPCQE